MNYTNKKTELEVMGYYINSTREDQLVQIKDLVNGKCYYEVLKQHDPNPIDEFICTQERFQRLYIKKQ